MAKSLQDFAKTNPPFRGKLCHTCALPEREEIDEALRMGIQCAQITEWLINEKHYTREDSNKIRYHIARRHYVTQPS